ncbi:hypothetical protein IC582_002120 [Cucumis melo]
MDTKNPPQVLPNGYVYSAKALERMSKETVVKSLAQEQALCATIQSW